MTLDRFPKLTAMADLFTENPTDDKFKEDSHALGQAIAGLALQKYYADMAKLAAMDDGPPLPDSIQKAYDLIEHRYLRKAAYEACKPLDMDGGEGTAVLMKLAKDHVYGPLCVDFDDSD